MRPSVDHQTVEIESFQERGAGKVLLRPVKDQKFPTNLRLEGNNSLIVDYPVGTRFKVQAALTSAPGGKEYLYTHWQWDMRVISRPDDEAA